MSSVHLNLRPCKTNFIFGNSQKSFGVKSGEYGVFSISVIDFWARNCLIESLVSWSIIMVETPVVEPKVQTFVYAQLHITASVST
jgi:hypothetical protein